MCTLYIYTYIYRHTRHICYGLGPWFREGNRASAQVVLDIPWPCFRISNASLEYAPEMNHGTLWFMVDALW